MTAPVSGATSQGFGDNPTANLSFNSWLIQTFGNYQPNGHTGVDYPVEIGTPVRAVASGTVKHVGWYSGSYADNPYWISPSFAGFVLVIDHGAFIGIYAHLSSSPVNVGEWVSDGQVVAYSGNTGGSTGPHLHFEILPDGWDFNNGMYGRINPASILAGTGGGIAAMGSVTSTSEPTIQEDDEMSAADVAAIRGDLNTVHNAVADSERRVRADVGTVHNTIIRDVGGQLGALRELVKQLAVGQGVDIDYTKVEAAAKSGAAEALANGIDVTVTLKDGK
jgi:hypothetical protein